MKFALNFSTLSALWLAASNSVAQAQQTIAELVVARDDFSTLETVVAAVPFAADFSQVNTATVFAPTNAAFAVIDQDLLNKLRTTPAFASHLENLLFYHIIPFAALSADIIRNVIRDGEQINTLSEEFLSLSNEVDGSITIDGNAHVIDADVRVDNGVVHVVDAVLLPSWVPVNAYQFAASIDDHSTLVSLIDDAMLTDTLNGPGPFTIFAPTNAAFSAASATDPDLDLADMDLLSKLLRTHVIAEIIFFHDITDGMEVAALSGDILKFKVMTDGSVTVNGILISVNDVDNLVNNGVVHVLGGIILPTPVATTATPVAVVTSAPVAITTTPAATDTAPVVAPTATPNSNAFGVGTFMFTASAMVILFTTMLL